MSESAVQTTRATYDEIAVAYRKRSWRPFDGLDQIASFRAMLAADAIVADVGCGPGHHTAALRAHGVRTIGVDLSAGMLRAGGLADVVQAGMRALPIRTGVLDGIWSHAALLHVPRILVPVALAEFGRVVRPGGALHWRASAADATSPVARLRGCGNDAELLHHPECVHDDSALGYLAVDESIDRPRSHRDAFARGQYAEKRAAVRTLPGRPPPDSAFVCNLFLDCPPHVGESVNPHGEPLSEPLTTRTHPRWGFVLDVVGVEDLVQCGQVVSGQDLVCESPQ
jgi:SAM-dependent methyltransferase